MPLPGWDDIALQEPITAWDMSNTFVVLTGITKSESEESVVPMSICPKATEPTHTAPTANNNRAKTLITISSEVMIADTVFSNK